VDNGYRGSVLPCFFHQHFIETQTVRPSSALLAAALLAAATACNRADQPATTDTVVAAPAPAVEPAVSIASPADGDSVSLPFTLRLEAQGVEVIAATGTAEPGKGHHHLVIDGDEPADSLPLPPMPVVIHMGNGATERVIDSLTPGSHRIIAIFAGGDHVPMKSVKRDTITVIVRK
jgi:Domain of unknown function (DUF4399)